MKILIVEDTEDSRVLLEDALTMRGYQTESAVNGVDALTKTRKAPPDLIISDILMPEMDGFEYCRQVKLDDKLKHIPFIFYSATFTEARDEALAMSLGASRFIIKPEDPITLLEIIDQVVQEAEINTALPDPQVIDADEFNYRHSVTLARKLYKKNAELEDSKKQLTTQNNNLRIIHKLSNFVNSTSSIDAILEETIDVLLSLTHPPLVAIYMLCKDQRQLQLSASYGFDDSTHLPGYCLPLSDSLGGVALKLGRMLVCNDFAQDERLSGGIKQRLQACNIGSGIVMPIAYHDKSFGCINVYYQNRHQFSAIETETLETIGKTVSISLANTYNKVDLKFIAHHDSLTGLSNRVYLHNILTTDIAKNTFSAAALFLIDLDRFKEVNDTLGHFIGDRLLKQVGPRLATVFAGKNILLSRLGGDEFSIFLYDDSDEKNLTHLAQMLRDSLRKTFVIDDIKLEIDASIGIARYPEHGRSSSGLLRSADVAMYEAKRTGKGIVIYDPAIDRHTPERLALSAEFGNAIRHGQLVVHYQPKMALGSNIIVGFEALVRWQHSTMGLIYPNDFIQLAEMSDAIHDLTQAVLDMALAQQKIWLDAGQNYSVSVNLSARNLNDDRCVEFLKERLKYYGTNPALVELEITETALMHDPDGAISLLHKISQLGVKLSVDDYGTGYSSLAYLRRLPINLLKIDREFVMDMLVNEQDEIIVNSTIALAHNLGLQVIAEGVEDQDTLSRLYQMGCDLVQGYFVSKPKPWHEIEAWLAAHHAEYKA